MTTRDEFAKAAMQAMLNAYWINDEVDLSRVEIAKESYNMADAMMVERKLREDARYKEEVS